MHAAAVHLVRRGYEAHQNGDYQLPIWGIVVLALTTIAFLALNASIEYTFGRLIPALVMVESSQTLIESAESNEPFLDEKKPLEVDSPLPEAELLLVKQAPITHTFCSTIRHLRAKAGFLSRFRGIAVFGAYAFASSTLVNLLGSLPFLPRQFAPVIAALVCANLATTWTHVAISNPSNKAWYKRIPSCKTWKKVACPTVCLAIANQMTRLVPMYLAGHLGMLDVMPHQLNALSMEERNMFVVKGLAVGFAGLMMAIIFILPAKVTLTRVQASLLSEEDETIVPFDRSFGGKVVPQILGGAGVVFTRDAWRTFTADSRLTLFKSYGKVMAMEIMLGLGFATLIFGELIVILGEDIKRFIPADGQTLFDGQ